MTSPEQMGGAIRGAEATIRQNVDILLAGMHFGEGAVTGQQSEYAKLALGRLDQIKPDSSQLGDEGIFVIRNFLTKVADGKWPTSEEADRVSQEIRK